MASNNDSSVTKDTKKSIYRFEIIPPNSNLKILSRILTRYGRVDNISKCNKCWSGFVTYNGEHKVPRKLWYRKTRLYAADRLCDSQRLQCDSMETAAVTEFPLEKLNEDCMYEIIKYLNIIDICHLKDMSGNFKKFDRVFDDVLRKRLGAYIFNLRKEVETHSGCSILTILKNAGKYIKHAIINDGMQTIFLKIILSKCSNLEDLTLDDIDISNYSSNEPQILMSSNLHLLRLINVIGSENDFTNFMNTFNGGIKQITVHFCSGFPGHHLTRFADLEHLAIGSNNNTINTDIEKCLTVNNATITSFNYFNQTLSLNVNNFFKLLSNLEICHLGLLDKKQTLQVELKYFKKLKVLKLSSDQLQFPSNVGSWKIFDTLQTLQIQCDKSDSSFNIIQNFYNLKQLVIIYFSYPENFLTELIGKFRNVECLQIGIDNEINRDQLMEFIKSMENLKRLYVYPFNPEMDVGSFLVEYKNWRDQYKPDMLIIITEFEIFSNQM